MGSRQNGIGQEEILAAIAGEQPAIERLLVELVAAPTVLGRESVGQDVMRAAFEDLGLEPRAVTLDPQALRAHPGASPFSWDVSEKANVVADWGPPEPSGGRSLILNGHIDVVSPEPSDMWSSPPFTARREGEWMYGRGAGDMKAGLAAIVGAVRGLRQLGVEPLAPVQLQSVVEEECTGNGALACVLAVRTGGRRDRDRADQPRDPDLAGRRALVPGDRQRPTGACRGGHDRSKRDRGELLRGRGACGPWRPS